MVDLSILDAAGGALALGGGALGLTAERMFTPLQRRHIERLFVSQFDKAVHNADLVLPSGARPRLKHVRVDEFGRVVADVRKPHRGITWEQIDDACDPDSGQLAQSLYLGKKLGVPEEVRLVEPPKNAAMRRILQSSYVGLPEPAGLVEGKHWTLDDCSPLRLSLGVGHDGHEWWVLDEDPHMWNMSRSGKGKGRQLRWLVTQAIVAGLDVLVIDGQGAMEHSAWDPFPQVQVVAVNQSELAKSLLQIELALLTIQAFGHHVVNPAGVAAEVDKWSDMPALVRRRVPRKLVIVDEVTSLTGMTGDTETDKIRKRIVALLVKGYTGGRKWGSHFAGFDQVSLAKSIPTVATTQATRFASLGGIGQQHMQNLSDLNRWPAQPTNQGCGLVGYRGGVESQITEIRVPNIERDRIKQLARRYGNG